MAEEPGLSYYLPIAGGRIIGFIPFPRVLVLCEMQSVSSRILTRIAVFISCGDNDNTTGTSDARGVVVIVKQSNGEPPLMLELCEYGVLDYDRSQVHSGLE